MKYDTLYTNSEDFNPLKRELTFLHQSYTKPGWIKSLKYFPLVKYFLCLKYLVLFSLGGRTGGAGRLLPSLSLSSVSQHSPTSPGQSHQHHYHHHYHPQYHYHYHLV